MSTAQTSQQFLLYGIWHNISTFWYTLLTIHKTRQQYINVPLSLVELVLYIGAVICSTFLYMFMLWSLSTETFGIAKTLADHEIYCENAYYNTMHNLHGL